ncbi:MAG: hypothetical protein P4M00_01120 [Azospirillaceae bacterium]|nr:hypothetical protein [Azospirillaceae bacterium]
MIGKSSLIWLGLTALASGVLFQTSYRVQHLDRELSQINQQIVDEQRAIRDFRAEWSYLNQPDQLARLAHEHLLLGPTAGSQFATLDQIPQRQEDASTVAAVPPPGHKPGKSHGLMVASYPDAHETLQ